MDGSLFGPYRIGPRLGAGAMGEVHEAYDTRRERYVALKRLIQHDDPGLEQRFQRESRIAARLDSPHVIPIHDFGVIDQRLFIDMRLVRGNDLSGVIESNGPLPLARAATLLTQLANALDSAHAAGLVHRDVKPSNALVATHRGLDFLYLADFGIVFERDAAGTRLTATGSTIGTPAYMAPEQLRAERIDHRVDVYALGCVLFEMLTGRTPFVATSVPVLCSHHLSTLPDPPSRFRGGLSPELDEAVLAALEKDPSRRPASACDLAEAVHRATRPTRPQRSLIVGTPQRGVNPAPSLPDASERPARSAVATTTWNHAALASVILGVILPVLGVAAGAVSLRQIASTGQRGRPLALVGITVGALLSIATVVVVIVYLSLTPSVSAASVETQIARRTGVALDDVSCPGRLPAKVGASLECTVGDVEPQIVRATTTAVGPDGVDFSLTAE